MPIFNSPGLKLTKKQELRLLRHAKKVFARLKAKLSR